MVNTSLQTSAQSPKVTSPKKSASAKRKASTLKLSASAKRRVKSSQNKAVKLYRQGQNTARDAYAAATDIGSSVLKLPRNLHVRERSQSVYDYVENRPLIFGAVGLGVGMMIAALLPSMHNTSPPRQKRKR